MGGDTSSTLPFHHPILLHVDDDSSLEQDISSIYNPLLPNFIRESTKTKDDEVDRENGWIVGEFDQVESQFSSAALDLKIRRSIIRNVYREIEASYDKLRIHSENLNLAKRNFLSYTPGAWIKQVGGKNLSDYDIPRTTSLILIGPKGSGKSSLINRISKVFEEDQLASERAQVSYNSSGEDGTFFLQEYMIPRNSNSFCLYDTRSLSDDSSDNIEMLEQWMTKGVRHGELITRKSDASSLVDIMRCKARRNFPLSSKIRMMNFVIFVVNGISVLKSINGDDDIEKGYAKVITTAFNCPYLSFGDDKPVIVITHGDLLSISDRVRIRMHLGNLLGIPPTKQIFDIPESCDPVTEMTIIDMLHYCLEHADKYLPPKNWTVDKDHSSTISARIYLITIVGIAIISAYLYLVFIHRHPQQVKPHDDFLEELEIVWRSIRQFWLDH